MLVFVALVVILGGAKKSFRVLLVIFRCKIQAGRQRVTTRAFAPDTLCFAYTYNFNFSKRRMCWAAVLAWRFDFCFSDLQRRARVQRRVPKLSRRPVTRRNLGDSPSDVDGPPNARSASTSRLQQAVKISEPQPSQRIFEKFFLGEPRSGISPKKYFTTIFERTSHVSLQSKGRLDLEGGRCRNPWSTAVLASRRSRAII